MASLRAGTRKDGSTYVQVLYRLDGKQSSTSFEDLAWATKFQKMNTRTSIDGRPRFKAIRQIGR
jgi:hypothetical protein